MKKGSGPFSLKKGSGPFFRSSVTALLLLAACATPRPEPAADSTAAERAKSALAAGQSKADVLAALGAGQVISFDSGYEVWLYRFGKTELVVLFAPNGLVTKTRLRSG